jgi:putative hydrolase of the HAD superfamily
MSYRAVIFDLGGVVIDSPLHVIADYERDLGLAAGVINRVVVDTGPSGAWSQLERGEIGMPAFQQAFEDECAAAGATISALEMMTRIAGCQIRPAMLEAIRRIRGEGLRVAALTNNWADTERREPADPNRDLRPLFHAFIESSVVGLRKPDPRIYHHVCTELEVAPEDSVFLDDIGRNLKAARELGMTTIKVDAPGPALAELSEHLGFALG